MPFLSEQRFAYLGASIVVLPLIVAPLPAGSRVESDAIGPLLWGAFALTLMLTVSASFHWEEYVFPLAFLFVVARAPAWDTFFEGVSYRACVALAVVVLVLLGVAARVRAELVGNSLQARAALDFALERELSPGAVDAPWGFHQFFFKQESIDRVRSGRVRGKRLTIFVPMPEVQIRYRWLRLRERPPAALAEVSYQQWPGVRVRFFLLPVEQLHPNAVRLGLL